MAKIELVAHSKGLFGLIIRLPSGGIFSQPVGDRKRAEKMAREIMEGSLTFEDCTSEVNTDPAGQVVEQGDDEYPILD